jgi:hypothetical protein
VDVQVEVDANLIAAGFDGPAFGKAALREVIDRDAMVYEVVSSSIGQGDMNRPQTFIDKIQSTPLNYTSLELCV